MPQSLAQILVHLVFSTKNREACLGDDICDELHAYIGGIVENQNKGSSPSTPPTVLLWRGTFPTSPSITAKSRFRGPGFLARMRIRTSRLLARHPRLQQGLQAYARPTRYREQTKIPDKTMSVGFLRCLERQGLLRRSGSTRTAEC